MIESIFRKLPAFKGKQRLARVLLKSKIEQYHNIYVNGKFDCIFFLPNIKENIGFEVFINGVYEKSTIEFIINKIPANGVMIDIGANIGTIAFQVLKKRKDIQALCIEASPKVFKYLKINHHNNNINNCVLVNKAMGEIDGDIVSFFSPEELFGKGSLSPVFTTEEEKIETLTLDSLVTANNLKNVDFIKIDVEGYEYSVFKGGEKTLRSAQAPDILFEFLDWAESSTNIFRPGDAQKLLWEYGYHLYKVDELNNLIFINDNCPIIVGSELIFASKKSK